MNESAELRRVLDRVAGNVRRVRLWTGLTACWLTLAAVAGASLLLRVGTAKDVPLAALAAGLAAVAVVLTARRSARDPREVARRIERKHPELNAALLTAVDQTGRLGFLQSAVVQRALAHHRTHDWESTLTGWRLPAARAAHWAAVVVLAVVLVAAVGQGRARRAGPAGVGAAVQEVPTGGVVDVTVAPGHAQIERGTALLVTATFPGFVPPEAALVVEGGGPAGTRAMSRNLDDPTFAGHVPAVDNNLSYRVEFPGGRSDTFHVTVFEYPQVTRVDARLVPPTHSGAGPKTVENIRHVTAIEGTEVTLLCRLNKPVTRAALADGKNPELPLVLHDAATNTYKATLTATESRRFKAKLADADGRANKVPTEIALNVTRDQPPVVRVPRPVKDVRVSPLEELTLKADVKDDVGLTRYGVSFGPVGQPPKEVVLHDAGTGARAKSAQPEHQINFEALKAEPGDSVAYHFWAEDVGPDGRPRRTAGDMLFAEVRHFDEVFVQGKGGEGECNCEDLAELQKRVVNAAWTLHRQEPGPTPTSKFSDDATVLRKSQHALVEKVNAVLANGPSKPVAEALYVILGHMTTAEAKFDEAATTASPAAVPPGIDAGKQAYLALLKLRGKMFKVAREGKGGGGKDSPKPPAPQQLNALELKDEDNRYETQQAARQRQDEQAKKDREQKENQEYLDRLKELSRRQTDLNERVKELQSAIDQAKTEAQKEELARQLKRLRDQQQEVLRDADDLRAKMEKEESRERTADARQQLDETRERLRQAAESMDKGKLPEAVTEGTRAERQLNQLRDDLRRDSASRFEDEVRSLREQARKLDDDQKQLTQQLGDPAGNQSRSLRDSGEREQVRRGFEQQRERLDQMMEQMRKTVQAAEQTEPKLAEELFNAARAATEQKVGENLTQAERMAVSGFPAEAADAAQQSGKGIEQLRQGVEKAAESVLGSQTEALKRAQRELDDLAGQLDREIAQAAGQPGKQPGQQSSQDGQPGNGGKPGQGKKPGQQPGEGGQQGQQAKNGPPGKQGQGQQGQGQGQGKQGQGQQAQQGEGQQGQGGQGSQQAQGQGQAGQGRGAGQGRRGLTDRPGEARSQQEGGNPARSSSQNSQAGEGLGGPGGPIRGQEYRNWSDRMRSVEELIEDPKLRADAAVVRDRVRAAREEFKRHSKEPDWALLTDRVAKPLAELRERVAEEVRRRESPDALVPIDRDPVPPEFADGVRRYYERLGSER